MSVPRRILIIEDSRPIREETKALLKKSFNHVETLEAENGIEGFKQMLSHPVDLVLCDLVMPQIDGFKFLQLKATRTEFDDIPVIMLTAIEDTDQKIRGLEQGANDYITKPFDSGEFLARVKVHLKLKGLQDELKQKNEMLNELATLDGLTKVYNRRHFLELGEHELSRAKRKALPLAFVLLDLDHFKQINDTFGHQVGDEVLVEVASSLSERLRNYDILGRYGGEEFTILMPDTGIEDAMRLSEKLRAMIQETIKPASVTGRDITISAGVAAFESGDYLTLHSLISRADLALYKAKETGRNRILPYSPDMEP